MTILYSARHYVVLLQDNIVYCYSYGKLIAVYDVINNILTTDNKQIITATNKAHLKLFKSYVKDLTTDKKRV